MRAGLFAVLAPVAVALLNRHFFCIPVVAFSNAARPRHVIQIAHRSPTGTKSVFPYAGTGRSVSIDRFLFPQGNFDPPLDENKISSVIERPLLAATDLMSILAFAAVGKASHAADGSINLGAVVVTALPFLVAWFSIAPLTGSYSSKATKDVITAVVYAGRGWILSIPMGCVLRGVVKGYVPPAPFVVVTMISTLLIISAARLAYTAVEDRIG